MKDQEMKVDSQGQDSCPCNQLQAEERRSKS